MRTVWWSRHTIVPLIVLCRRKPSSIVWNDLWAIFIKYLSFLLPSIKGIKEKKSAIDKQSHVSYAASHQTQMVIDASILNVKRWLLLIRCAKRVYCVRMGEFNWSKYLLLIQNAGEQIIPFVIIIEEATENVATSKPKLRGIIMRVERQKVIHLMF